jgi:hypothetical protein
VDLRLVIGTLLIVGGIGIVNLNIALFFKRSKITSTTEVV